MLLLAVMASTASARSIAFPEPQYCCNAYTAECESCKAGVSVEEFCRTDPTFPECPIEQPPICCNAYNAKCESCKQGLAEELTLWSAKLVTPVSLRTNSAEEILTHMSALRSLPSHLILITATPQSGTPKSCMARWVPRSAAGTETGRASLSAND